MRFSAYEAGRYATNGKYMRLPALAAAFKYGIYLMKRKKRSPCRERLSYEVLSYEVCKLKIEFRKPCKPLL